MKHASLGEVCPPPVRIIRSRERVSPMQQIQRSLSKEKRKLNNIQAQIEQKRKRMFEENRRRISARLQEIRASQIRRRENEIRTNQELRLIKSHHEQKLAQQSRMEDLEQHEKLKKFEKVMQERRLLMRPLNFADIYLQNKTGRSRITCRSTSLTTNNHHETQLSRNQTRASNDVKEQAGMKDSFLQQKNKARQIVLRRKEYGQQAERNHHNVRVHTEPNKYDVMSLRNRRATELEYFKQARKKRKAQLPSLFEGDIVAGASKQIRGIMSSNRSVTDKFQRLSSLSRSYLSKHECGSAHGLQIAAQASLALADLYLQNF